MFFWNSCFFYDTRDVGNLISGSSAFSKSSLNIWKFMVHILLKLGLENFEHYFASLWDKSHCAVVSTFVGIAFLWDWNENWPFPILWPLLSFPDLLAYWVQHFHSSIFQDLGFHNISNVFFSYFRYNKYNNFQNLSNIIKPKKYQYCTWTTHFH